MNGEVVGPGYRLVHGRRLRRGITTGTCAAAAAKAAALALLTGAAPTWVDVETPAGVTVVVPVEGCRTGGTGPVPVERFRTGAAWAECAVVKDGGDDADATSGLRIVARVSVEDGDGLEICAGEGVGRVTLPGLRIPVGEPAINEVPRRMIVREVLSVVGPGAGPGPGGGSGPRPGSKVVVTIRVPGGEEAARRTLNPRLGIVGGISIIGTTGIVEPMSDEAWRDALALEIHMKAVRGEGAVVVAPGNYGERFSVDALHLRPDAVVRCGNFVGFAIECCALEGVRAVLLVGHAGKFVKLAAGVFNTHNRVADARMETVAAAAALHGAGAMVVREIMDCPTTEAALEVVDREGLGAVYSYLRERINRRVMDLAGGGLDVETVLFSLDRGVLSWDRRLEEFIEVHGLRRPA